MYFTVKNYTIHKFLSIYNTVVKENVSSEKVMLKVIHQRQWNPLNESFLRLKRISANKNKENERQNTQKRKEEDRQP